MINKNLDNRLNKLEQIKPDIPIIDKSYIDDFENYGYPIRSRITEKSLDYSSQDSFNRSVVALLTKDELEELADSFPIKNKN